METYKVTVIMGIFNCESTLEASLNSLINQTYQNFDVIMCDDGSIDSTRNIAFKFCDNYPGKFKLLINEKNMGLNYTLNKCLKYAKGYYIARMDGDDLSLPKRFEKQVMFLNNHPEIAFVSSPMIHFDENGDWGFGKPIEYPDKKNLFRNNPFHHGPCMVKREAYESVNGYSVDKKLLRVEDYHLWIKMYAKGYRGCNMKEPLYKMRDDQNALSRRTFKSRLNGAYVKYIALKKLKLPIWNFVFIFRPIVLGLLPTSLYKYLRRQKLK